MFGRFRIPRPIDIVKDDLSDFSNINEGITINDRDDLALIFFLRALLAHERDLIDELEASEWLEKTIDIEIIIKGDFINNNTAIDSTLTEITPCIEKLRIGIGELFARKLDVSSPFINKIIVKKLILTKDLLDSKFEIKIQYNDIYNDYLMLNNNYSLNFESIFLSILTLDKEVDPLSAITMTLEFKLYYLGFLNLIIDNQLTISTRTKKHPFFIDLTPEKARKRKEAVEKFNID
jgi:hypothetical protein